MRTIIELTDDQLARLELIAERDGISRAEAVRRAIDVAYPEGAASATVEKRRRAAFGLWRGAPVHALAFVDRLRDEWERPVSRRSGK